MISMKNFFITFRSVTYAQIGERLLKRGGIECFVRRTPKALTNRQCGYCLQLRPWDIDNALALLRSGQVQFGKVYALEYDGKFEEMAL